MNQRMTNTIDYCFSRSWQTAQICRPSAVKRQPFLTAWLHSPSNHALPSLIRRPVRSSLRGARRNSMALKPCGLQISQNMNVRMVMLNRRISLCGNDE